MENNEQIVETPELNEQLKQPDAKETFKTSLIELADKERSDYIKNSNNPDSNLGKFRSTESEIRSGAEHAAANAVFEQVFSLMSSVIADQDPVLSHLIEVKTTEYVYKLMSEASSNDESASNNKAKFESSFK